MFRWKAAGAIALGLALTTAASAGMAKERHAAGQDWRNARAQAIPNSDIMMSGGRTTAIRECNNKAASLKDYTWGEQQADSYRACMAERGQPE
jgi:hypothetical protein